MSDNEKAIKQDQEAATVTLKTLPVGDGVVRLGMQIGVTREYVKGVWLKPSIYLEVEKPQDVALDAYAQMLLEAVASAFVTLEQRNIQLAHVPPKKARPVSDIKLPRADLPGPDDNPYSQDDVEEPKGIGDPYG